MITPRRRALVVSLAVLLLAAGCGGDGDDDTKATDPPTDEVATDDPSTDDPTTDDDGDEPELLDGEVLLEDGFEDDSNVWIGTAPIEGPVTAEIEDDVLVFAGSEEGGFDLWPDAIASASGDLGDQHVSARVSVTHGGVGTVLCRLDPEGEFPTQYGFSLSSAGTYAIRKWDGSSFDAETLATNPPEVKEQADDDVKFEDVEFEPAFEPEDGQEFTVTGQCVDTDEGVELAMFVDDELVLTVVDEDDTIDTGIGGVGVEQSGLATGGEMVPYGVAWDDFELVGLGDDLPEIDPGDEPDGPDVEGAAVTGDGSEYCLQEGDLPDGFLPLTGQDNTSNAMGFVFDDPAISDLAEDSLVASWMVLPEGGAGDTDVTASCSIYIFSDAESAEEVYDWWVSTTPERSSPPPEQGEVSADAVGEDPVMFLNEIGGRPDVDFTFRYENAFVSVGISGTSQNTYDVLAKGAEELGAIVHERLVG